MFPLKVCILITNSNEFTLHCFKFQFNRSASTAGCRSAGGATGQTGVCKVEPSSYTPFASRSVSSRTGSSSFTRLPSLCVILKTGAGDLELVLEGHRIVERRVPECNMHGLDRSQQHDITQWPRTRRSVWWSPSSLSSSLKSRNSLRTWNIDCSPSSNMGIYGAW